MSYIWEYGPLLSEEILEVCRMSENTAVCHKELTFKIVMLV